MTPKAGSGQHCLRLALHLGSYYAVADQAVMLCHTGQKYFKLSGPIKNFLQEIDTYSKSLL